MNLWLPYDEPHQPFLLSSPYEEDALSKAREYGAMHGLSVGTFSGDDWYGHNTHPVRLTVKADVQAWPLSLLAAPVLMAWPVRWGQG